MDLKRGTALTLALLGLTMTSGIVEAVSFLALGHVFTAMMTGNLLLLAFGIAGGAGLSPGRSAVSLAAFVTGALAGARLESRVAAHRHRWFVAGLLAEAVLLGVAGVVAWRLDGADTPASARHYAVVALVGVAMGVRSVTTLRAHVPDLPTTLATRTLTSLLSSLAFVAGPELRPAAGERPWLRRSAAVASMFVGGLLGGWMLKAGWRPAGPLLLVAAAALAIAVAYGLAPRYRSPVPPGGG
ncbi:YoaK family protein [Kitasatospora sp. NPDC050543]|uniref:YoaK family protein n=1 Tax=Kitasatospora sp. NPDC050543 TaxID=3364054 RepID=UPI00378E4E8D